MGDLRCSCKSRNNRSRSLVRFSLPATIEGRLPFTSSLRMEYVYEDPSSLLRGLKLPAAGRQFGGLFAAGNATADQLFGIRTV